MKQRDLTTRNEEEEQKGDAKDEKNEKQETKKGRNEMGEELCTG
jgi:hypothetical protein